ncbi:MAG TPA: response regulator [Verrucomicrobiae bacterium]|nr:response regulator [Verrucomicrobiae bacterium]
MKQTPTPAMEVRQARPLSVLLVEDSLVDARVVSGLLKASGDQLECHHVLGCAEALRALETQHYDVVLLDLNLPDSSGYETFASIYRVAPRAAILVLSSSDIEELAIRTVREGAQDYLVKGSFDGRLLLRSIRYAFERNRAEEALRNSEATVRAIFENSLDGIVIVGRNGICREANSAAAILFGTSRQDLIGKNIHRFTGQDFEEEWVRFRRSNTGRGQFWVRREDGTKRLVDCCFSANILPECDLCMLRDMTEQQSLEDQLRHSQKMEAVGRLAGGVAHDFNNIMGIISGYAELLQLNSTDETVISRTDKILSAILKASSLTKQLLAFGHKQFVSPKLLDVSAVLDEVKSMVHCLVGAEVQVILKAGEGVRLVKADQGQLEQVILNLASNASDAMPLGGTLTLSVENYTSTGLEPQVLAGEYVRLSVSDTGTGMDSEIQSHIFEPFFTTKKAHSGLGLSTVYGIVKQSGGYITVQAAPNGGSTFRVHLPVAAEARILPAVPADTGWSGQSGTNGHETILLVDDEDALREAAAEYLEGCGYKVLKARDGKEGMDFLNSYQGEIAAVVSDIVMPQVSGRGLVDHVRNTRPDTGVLLISGYADDAVVRHGIFLETTAFLQKPFTLQALGETIRSLIKRRS